MKIIAILLIVAASASLTASCTELNTDRPDFCVIGETCEVVDVPAPKSLTTGVLGLVLMGVGLYFRRKS